MEDTLIWNLLCNCDTFSEVYDILSRTAEYGPWTVDVHDGHVYVSNNIETREIYLLGADIAITCEEVVNIDGFFEEIAVPKMIYDNYREGCYVNICCLDAELMQIYQMTEESDEDITFELVSDNYPAAGEGAHGHLTAEEILSYVDPCEDCNMCSGVGYKDGCKALRAYRVIEKAINKYYDEEREDIK